MQPMRAGDPVRLMRWSRWGILITALLMGSGMVLSAWSSHSRVHNVAWQLIRGQAQLPVDAIRQKIHDVNDPPPPRARQKLFAKLQDQGLRYLALLVPAVPPRQGRPWAALRAWTSSPRARSRDPAS